MFFHADTLLHVHILYNIKIAIFFQTQEYFIFSRKYEEKKNKTKE